MTKKEILSIMASILFTIIFMVLSHTTINTEWAKIWAVLSIWESFHVSVKITPVALRYCGDKENEESEE